jgi:hypothetical protein
MIVKDKTNNKGYLIDMSMPKDCNCWDKGNRETFKVRRSGDRDMQNVANESNKHRGRAAGGAGGL